MIKFFNSKNIPTQYTETANSVDISVSPIREIITKKDYGSQSFVIDDGERVYFKDTFVLLVNVKDCASVYFVLDSKSFNKEEAVEKITVLKDMPVADIREVKLKIFELFKTAKQFNPYFVIYHSKGAIPLFLNEVYDLFIFSGIDNRPLFYLDSKVEVPVVEEKKEKAKLFSSFKNPFKKKDNDEEKVVEAKEVAPIREPQPVIEPLPRPEPVVMREERREEYVPVTPIREFDPIKEEKKEKAPKEKIKIKDEFNSIKENKFHFLFLTIAVFLFSLALSIAIGNAAAGKTISVLFYICAFAGAFLFTYIFIDYFKVKKFKDRLMIYSCVFALLGIALSALGVLLFYSIDQSGVKDAISKGKLILIAILSGIAIIPIGTSIGYLVNRAKNKNKAN